MVSHARGFLNQVRATTAPPQLGHSGRSLSTIPSHPAQVAKSPSREKLRAVNFVSPAEAIPPGSSERGKSVPPLPLSASSEVPPLENSPPRKNPPAPNPPPFELFPPLEIVRSDLSKREAVRFRFRLATVPWCTTRARKKRRSRVAQVLFRRKPLGNSVAERDNEP